MTDFSRPEPSKELEKLKMLEGDWESHDTHYPLPWMPDGGTGKSKNSFHEALDGYGFLADYNGSTPFGSIKGHGIWFYDSERNQYKIQWYDNFGNHISGNGNFENDQFIFDMRYRMGGEDIFEQHTIKDIKDNSYLYVIEIEVDGKLCKSSELRYQRSIS